MATTKKSGSGEGKADTAKKPAPKTAAKDAAPRTSGIHAPVQPSKELGAVVGDDRLPRSEVISKVWAYIKEKNLQNPENKREIIADERLKKVFGKDKVTMFEMNKYISAHVKA